MTMSKQQTTGISFLEAVMIILLAAMLPMTVVGFVSTTSPAFVRHVLHQSTASEQDSADITTATDCFSDATILDFTLEHHKPLGCTVEESLAHPKEKHIFVTKLVEDGFAQAAGLQVGDVLVAIPGIFGDLTNITGLGIEQVKSLVSGREESEPLELRIARGTDVMEQHENALVELCMTPGANDEEMEECVTTIMAGAYAEEDDDDDDKMMECDDENECLLDDMFNMWAEDMPNVPKPRETEQQEPEEELPAPAPWNARSSPSGTYQRDPATGEMKRIS